MSIRKNIICNLLGVFLIVLSAQAKSIELIGQSLPPGSSSQIDISLDGRYVVYTSDRDILSEDTNRDEDVYLYDRQTGITKLISVSSDGKNGRYWSQIPSISEDGRYIAFSSINPLVPSDTNTASDIYVHDQQSGFTERVSISSDGVQGNSWSGSSNISPDGRYVVFDSTSNNLVPGDTNQYNRHSNIFFHDRQTGLTELISISSSGEQGNSSSGSPVVSEDGRYVAFRSSSDNLVINDTNGSYHDLFIHDRVMKTTEVVSVLPNGEQLETGTTHFKLSQDWRYIAFYEFHNIGYGTSGEGDVYVHDRETKQTSIVSVSTEGIVGNRGSYGIEISPDGRFVSFRSAATNFVEGVTNRNDDTFIHDRLTGITQRISLSSRGQQGDGSSYSAQFSADNKVVVFSSFANNLVTNDIHYTGRDVFVTENPLFKMNPNIMAVIDSNSGVGPVGSSLHFTARLINRTTSDLTNCRVVARHPSINPYDDFTINYAIFHDQNRYSIPRGGSKTYRVRVDPKTNFQRNINLRFRCKKAFAIPLAYKNSLLVTGKTSLLKAEDHVKLENGTNKQDLIIDLNDGKYWAIYSVKLNNTGSTPAVMLLSTSTTISQTQLSIPRLCETQGGGSFKCIQPSTRQLQVNLEPGEVKRIKVFAHAKDAIAQKPATNRIFVEARDQAGALIAKNSIGIYTK